MFFSLIMSVIIGDPETGPVHTFVIDHALTQEDCAEEVDSYQNIWLGNNSIGMYCELEGVEE